MRSEPTNAREMKTALFRYFWNRYAVLTEVSMADPESKWPDPQRRIADVLLWQKNDRIAIEVKVTKTDLLTDVADPRKQALWASVTHRLAFAVPSSLLAVALEVVPPKYGVIEVASWQSYPDVKWARRAPKVKGRVPAEVQDNTLQALLVRCADAEAKIKGHGHSDGLPEDPEALRAEAKRLTHDLKVANAKADRLHDKNIGLTRALAQVESMPCAYCDGLLRPSRVGFQASWEHVGGKGYELEDACRKLRPKETWGTTPAIPVSFKEEQQHERNT